MLTDQRSKAPEDLLSANAGGGIAPPVACQPCEILRSPTNLQIPRGSRRTRIFLGVNVEFPGLPLHHSIHAEQFLVTNLTLNDERHLRHFAVSAAPKGPSLFKRTSLLIRYNISELNKQKKCGINRNLKRKPETSRRKENRRKRMRHSRRRKAATEERRRMKAVKDKEKDIDDGDEDREERSLMESGTNLRLAQLKRADNCALKEENYRIRYENNAIGEALKHTTKTLTLMNKSFEPQMLREE
ncbi:hypothetical protein Bca52824_060312 [Brassica carinata]|uniref:Uncharacterized protein n=1 Tax=Brassica carinata TaxID=52824 RepID=A0A8X7UGE2_BRACI|nr:hypothetical protein Bca52824_060312 [Brassica carinata]